MTSQKASSQFANSPFGASTDWLKPATQAPMAFYTAMWNQALRFTERSLRDQADYVQKLSECRDPAAALKCNAEFMQQSWARSVDEGSKLLKTVQSNISSSSADN